MSAHPPYAAAPARRVCRHCGADLLGAYCHACGRRPRGSLPTLSRFGMEAAAEVADFGRRLVPTLGTLTLRPGRLSRAYVEGYDADQTHPVRLFVLAGAAAFVATRASRGLLFLLSMSPVASGVGEEVAVWVALLVAVPAGALVLKALFRGARLVYLAHLIFTLHLFTFLLLLSAAESLIGAVVGSYMTTSPLIGVAAVGVALVYSLVAFRTFYGDPWWRIITKGLALLLLYVGVLGWLAELVLG